MQHPIGSDILSYLVELLAEQHGVTITYKIKEKEVA